LGEAFIHESYIGSKFLGRVEALIELAGRSAVTPSIEGAAIATGFNTIWIDQQDQFWKGFTVN
jgi:4-hydroxyproline epimerase